MGMKSRRKGKRGEQEVAALLKAHGYAGARRGAAQSRVGTDAADVEGTPWWVECKIGARLPSVGAALAQALADTDGRPIVVFARADREEWIVAMRAVDWLQMVAR